MGLGEGKCFLHFFLWNYETASFSSKLSAQAAPVFPLLPCTDLVGFGLLCFWVF